MFTDHKILFLLTFKVMKSPDKAFPENLIYKGRFSPDPVVSPTPCGHYVIDGWWLQHTCYLIFLELPYGTICNHYVASLKQHFKIADIIFDEYSCGP